MSDGYYDTSYPPSLWTSVDPSITSLNPNTVGASAGATTVTVTGTNFDESSVVEIDQVAQTTTFVNATTLTVSYDPTVAGTVMFTVRRDEEESNSFPFTVTAEEEPAGFTATVIDESELPPDETDAS